MNKRNIVTLICLSLVFFPLVFSGMLSAQEGSPPTGVEVGKKAPDFSLLTLEGKQVSLMDFVGKAVFLCFFTTW